MHLIECSIRLAQAFFADFAEQVCEQLLRLSEILLMRVVEEQVQSAILSSSSSSNEQIPAVSPLQLCKSIRTMVETILTVNLSQLISIPQELLFWHRTYYESVSRSLTSDAAKPDEQVRARSIDFSVSDQLSAECDVAAEFIKTAAVYTLPIVKLLLASH